MVHRSVKGRVVFTRKGCKYLGLGLYKVIGHGEGEKSRSQMVVMKRENARAKVSIGIYLTPSTTVQLLAVAQQSAIVCADY